MHSCGAVRAEIHLHLTPNRSATDAVCAIAALVLTTIFTTFAEKNMKQTDKYKTLAALVRGFFEGFMSGVLDGQNVGKREKKDPKMVKQAMLNHYEDIAPTFHDLIFYPIAVMNFDLETITAKVKHLYAQSPTPELILRTACSDDAMHQAVVAEYRRNFSSLLEGRLPTEQEHFDNYTRNSNEPATVDTKTAIREVVKTTMRAYLKGLECSTNEDYKPNNVSIMLLMIYSMNMLINDSPIEPFAAQAQGIDEVILKACGSKHNVDLMGNAMSSAYKEMLRG